MHWQELKHLLQIQGRQPHGPFATRFACPFATHLAQQSDMQSLTSYLFGWALGRVAGSSFDGPSHLGSSRQPAIKAGAAAICSAVFGAGCSKSDRLLHYMV